ncbi:MAG TPA: translation initiation factor IF-2 subunit gamma, partial [Candidatus Nanoarchaeia archaeon]|nr:translation initiation factor IF-2 subunit gamma [Candidatus Nanoarchaeia archaeon]
GSVNEAVPGGNFGIATQLDPSIARGDSLSGSVVCTDDSIVSVFTDLMDLKPSLMNRVVGSSKELSLGNLKVGESLMINAYTAKTLGLITKVTPDKVTVNLKLPIAIVKGDKVAMSRFVSNKWRLSGSAVVL